MNIDFIQRFRGKVFTEFENHLLPFWMNIPLDQTSGGFYGRIHKNLQIEADAPKGLVLNSRLLWTFSSVYRFNPNPHLLKLAQRAYQYLVDHFWDKVYGGMFWLLDSHGNPLDAGKKVYGQAFALYGLSEYYAASGDQSALNTAVELYHLIEQHHCDSIYQGYRETSHRDWSEAENQQLSEVDMNVVKSMNAHLHLLEAYANLLLVWEDSTLRRQLTELVDVFLTRIADDETGHFKLFFDQQWQSRSAAVSFGHDIEGSWLLCRAAEILGDQNRIRYVRPVTERLVNATLAEGMNEDGGIYFQRNNKNLLDTDVHWWVQAEAIVGFVNHYQLTHCEEMLQAAYDAWEFVEKHLVDREHGEWFYKVDQDRQTDLNMFKVSEWKGPYHNCRACMEIIRRLDQIIEPLEA
ncbi:AGE family epimerase/isomerase [bacterium]|nr:AGE family epimerase/isomerase [bacterium]RQV93246.1 MAG: N-acyl-D-glucosamine 2-epimerase [bacterium]